MPHSNTQKQLTEIFILFPEFIDTHHLASSIYICDVKSPLNEDVPTEVDEILNNIEFFDYERCFRYYDGKNLLGLVHPYSESIYPNVETAIYSRLQEQGCLDWREMLSDKFPQLMYINIPLGKDTCGQVFHRGKTNTPTLKCSTVLFAPSSVLDKKLLQSTLVDSSKKKAKISIAQSIHELYDWFVKNRLPQRRFDYNPKHGENRIERRLINNEWVCPLRCRRIRAQELLEKAIGDNGIEGSLWYFDEKENMHIYFENQNEEPQPAFHGYHVEKGDDNFENIDINKLSLIIKTEKNK